MERKAAMFSILVFAVLFYAPSVSAICAIYCPPPQVQSGCRCVNLPPIPILKGIAFPRAAFVECPPVCAIACPYGKVRDERGCPTCSCNPPPKSGPYKKPQVPFSDV